MEISPTPHQTNTIEFNNSTLENQKIDQIDTPQNPYDSPMPITTDETQHIWSNTAESSAHKRQAPPTTTSSAPSRKFTSSINENADYKLVWNKIQSLKGLNDTEKLI